MQTKAVFPWQIMPCDRIIHDGRVVRVTFTQPDGTGKTYIDYIDRYGLPATFRRGPFERVLKVIGPERLF